MNAPRSSARETDLERFQRELDAASARAHELCSPLDDGTLSRAPRPGAWSIAEILRHLEITNETFAPGLREVVERERRRGRQGTGPFRLSAWGRLLVWYVEPPPPIRLPAPKPLRPTLDGPPGEALSGFLSSQQRFAEIVRTLEGLDLARATYVSPIARYIRMSALAFLRVHTAHERRHLWQAENVVQLCRADRSAPAATDDAG